MKDKSITRSQKVWWHRTKKLWLMGASVVFMAEIVHSALNMICDPLTGPFDMLLHDVLFFGFLLFIPAIIGLMVVLLERIYHRWMPQQLGIKPSLLLVAILAFEVGYVTFGEPRGISSCYSPLLPDFVAGGIVAMLIVVSAWALGRKHTRFRVVAYVIAFYWALYPAIVDLIYYTEGTSRGTGPLWKLPVIHYLFISYITWHSYFLLFMWLMAPAALCSSVTTRTVNTLDYRWVNNPWPAGGAVVFIELLVFTLCLDRNLFRSPRRALQAICVILSASVFASFLPMWVRFLAD